MNALGRSLPSPVREPDVDIGVVYTHERQWMPRLLETLAASCPGVKARLILVDNCSDGIEPWLDYFPETRVVRNERRLLYAANLNRMLSASTARYALLLNTDMYFDPADQCVSRMVAFMDQRPQCGMSGCGVYHEEGDFAWPARRFQTAAVILARRFGLGRFMPGTLDRYLYRDRHPSGTWECDWLSGCFLMARREAIAEVGPFDEDFVKYFEDVDMCLRMARAGWQVTYHGGARCYHLERRTSRNLLSVDAFRHLRSYLRWHAKWGCFAPSAAPAPTPQQRPA